MKRIEGKYYFAERSESCSATLVLTEQGSIQIFNDADGALIQTSTLQECQQGPALPDLPIELFFTNQDRFTPNDVAVKWDHSFFSTFLQQLESKFIYVLIAILVLPVTMWLIFSQGVPAAAHATAPLVPTAVTDELGETTLKVMDYILDPSELTQEQQDRVLNHWRDTLAKTDLSETDYQVLFRNAGGTPNAFALADGTLVLFDELVVLLEEKPELITAILLHEAGHIEHRHNIELLIQSSIISVVYALLLGDMEGFAEIILGVGVSVGESAFSRRMEDEADVFALQQLRHAGLSPSLFGEALEEAFGDEERSGHHWEEYFSSHPDTQSRINQANSFEKEGAE